VNCILIVAPSPSQGTEVGALAADHLVAHFDLLMLDALLQSVSISAIKIPGTNKYF
jgi:hypothetical protein